MSEYRFIDYSKLYNTHEVAGLLGGKTLPYVRALCKKNSVAWKAVKVVNTWYVDREAFHKYLESVTKRFSDDSVLDLGNSTDGELEDNGESFDELL